MKTLQPHPGGGMKPPGWVFRGPVRTEALDTGSPTSSAPSSISVVLPAAPCSDDAENAQFHSKNSDNSDAYLWSEKLLNPLDIRFSQKSVHPCFDSRGSIEEQVHFIEHCETDGGFQLISPFPMIRVLEVYPGHFVSLDNRRLYCLQRKAVELHPDKCFIYCLVTPKLPRHRRKTEFRKFTAGKQGGVEISIESKHSVHSVWNWNEAICS